MGFVNTYGIAHNNVFPGEIPTALLEKILNESFLESGREIIEGYFDVNSEYYPTNLWFCVCALKKGDFYKDAGELVGGLIATKEKIKTDLMPEGEFTFKYIDKFGVIPAHQENGVGKNMMNAGLYFYSEGEEILPAVLRTSVLQSHEYYLKRSDNIYEPVISKQGTEYYVHGFGFKDKTTMRGLFPNAEGIFRKVVAPYVAAMPPTLVKKPLLAEQTNSC